MSISAPVKIVDWSTNGVDWNVITDDVLSVEAEHVDLIGGMPTLKLVLSNPDGKYAAIFPAYSTETGLYYYFRYRVNGVTIMIARSEGIRPEQMGADEVPINGIIVGGSRIQKIYSSIKFEDTKADDAIEEVVDWVNGEIPVVNYTSPSSLATINRAFNRRYGHDIIRTILEEKGLVGILKPTSGQTTQSDLLIFDKNSASYRLSTIFTEGSNLITYRAPRDVEESANILELTGCQTTALPADHIAWTESLSYWNAVGHTTIDLCTDDELHINTKVFPDSTASIHIQSGASGGSNWRSVWSWFGLDLLFRLLDEISYVAIARFMLNDALKGRYFDALKRNATLFSFYWSHGINFPTSLGIQLKLVDGNGTVILSNGNRLSDLFKALPSGPGYWSLQSFIIGANARIDTNPSGLHANYDYYYESDVDPANPFDWTKLSEVSIMFATTGQYRPQFWIGGMWFTQDYIPTVWVQDPKQRGVKYDPRMQHIDVPEITDDAELDAYGQNAILATAAPSYMMDALVSHDPNVEMIWAGYQTRFSIPTEGITSSMYWRIIKATYYWDRAQGHRIRIQAIPATSGSEDYSHTLGNKLWNREPSGILKSIIDALQDLRDTTEKFGINPPSPPVSGWTLSADQTLFDGNPTGEEYYLSTLITAKTNSFTGSLTLTVTNDIGGTSPTSAVDQATLSLSPEQQEDSTSLRIFVPDDCNPGDYTVTVAAEDAGGTTSSVKITVRIGTGVVPNNQPCVDNEDCSGGDVCSSGECKQSCSGDDDCASGKCEGGVCEKPNISLDCGTLTTTPEGQMIIVPVTVTSVGGFAGDVDFAVEDVFPLAFSLQGTYTLLDTGATLTDGSSTTMRVLIDPGTWGVGETFEFRVRVCGDMGCKTCTIGVEIGECTGSSYGNTWVITRNGGITATVYFPCNSSGEEELPDYPCLPVSACTTSGSNKCHGCTIYIPTNSDQNARIKVMYTPYPHTSTLVGLTRDGGASCNQGEWTIFQSMAPAADITLDTACGNCGYSFYGTECD